MEAGESLREDGGGQPGRPMGGILRGTLWCWGRTCAGGGVQAVLYGGGSRRELLNMPWVRTIADLRLDSRTQSHELKPPKV